MHEPLRSQDDGPTRARRLHDSGVRTAAATVIHRDAPALYAAWRGLTSIPRFVDDVLSVSVIDERTSRWLVKGPGATSYQWTAEILRDAPGEAIAFASTGGDLTVAGSIRFLPLPLPPGGPERGARSQVKLVVDYIPPAGRLGEAVARMMREHAGVKVRKALHAFRQLMETGEIATATGQPAGENRWRTDRPGQDARGVDADVTDIALPTPHAPAPAAGARKAEA
jgi:uncharacterized membrane protein